MLQYLIVLVCLAGPALAQIDCTRLTDGNYGIGCQEYTQCTGGVGTTVTCPSGEVYDSDTSACAAIGSVTTPCASSLTCPDNTYKRYVHPASCNYFFTCVNGDVVGIQPCSQPTNALLVFEGEYQVCVWVWNAWAPCGPLTTPVP